MTRRCETCRFWFGYDQEANKIGECRRYAPRPIETGQLHTQWHHPQFPHMRSGGWCGEHHFKIDGANP